LLVAASLTSQGMASLVGKNRMHWMLMGNGPATTSAIHGLAAKEKWDKKKHFLQGKSRDIDWEAQGKAISRVQRLRQVWIVKHSVGMCGVGVWMKRWDQKEGAENVWKTYRLKDYATEN
jgi:hypothetical protein